MRTARPSAHQAVPAFVITLVLTAGPALGGCGPTGSGLPAAEADNAAEAPVLTSQASGTSALLQAVSVVSGEVAWVSGHDGAILRTENGGETWSRVPSPVGDSLQFRDVHAFSGDEAAVLTAGSGPASRLYFTPDAGVTWTLGYLMEDERGFLDCLDFWDDRGVAYGDSFEGVPFVLRSTDRGRTWDRVEAVHLPQAPEGEGGFAASGTCVRTAANGIGWIATGAGGSARIMRTADYGATWAAVDVPVVRGASAGLTTVSFRDERVGIALGGDLGQMDAHTDNVVVTMDGGVTWTPGGRPALTGPVYGSDWVPGGSVVVAVGPAGADWSPDGGASWIQLDTVDYWATGFAGDGTGWMTGPEGRITRVRFER